jgi:uncharacterized protein YxeA
MKKILAILIVVALSVSTMANYCGKNCPSNDCESCPCGEEENYENVEEWCRKFSEWNQVCCQCIMSHESNGNSNAANYNAWDHSYDVGLWQINTVNWGVCSGGQPPCDGSTNLECAIDVWKWGGNSFSLWATATGCGC